ncbi:hypothetical protein [uncultured Desulfobulbus sp.]|uniref:hypothetical protein n=1 Tax=uncultured Desulfobulbus sp. TaxID=239745 RepID=UPI0029C76A17|nr:hypothetical protein [uncultured Desulfobulbus sp.]
MGLFRRKAPPVEGKNKRFRIELGWRGMFGLVVVCFCLFLWMFLLGIWAGQTILLPPRTNAEPISGSSKQPPVKTVEENDMSRQQQRTSAP